MAGLKILNRQDAGITVVSNSFIDQFLSVANGEFIKVYLLILRLAAGYLSLSVSEIADRLDLTEGDVLRALKYWEKADVLKLQKKDGAIIGIVILGEQETDGASGGRKAELTMETKTPEGMLKEKNEQVLPVTEEKAKNTKVKKVNLSELNLDPAFLQLLFIARQYTGKDLIGRDLDILANLYQGIGMSDELLEYAIEYCVENGHKSMRYIETVALAWHEKGIRTVAEAKNECVMGGKNTYAVLKAFGISGRNPAPAERRFIDKWYREYGFSVEVVEAACDRTMRAIHQPSFEYADKILSDWKKSGVKETDDIQRLDSKKAATEKKAAAKTETKNTNASNNRFHNFTERDIDVDDLMRKLTGIG